MSEPSQNEPGVEVSFTLRRDNPFALQAKFNWVTFYYKMKQTGKFKHNTNIRGNFW